MQASSTRIAVVKYTEMQLIADMVNRWHHVSQKLDQKYIKITCVANRQLACTPQEEQALQAAALELAKEARDTNLASIYVIAWRSIQTYVNSKPEFFIPAKPKELDLADLRSHLYTDGFESSHDFTQYKLDIWLKIQEATMRFYKEVEQRKTNAARKLSAKEAPLANAKSRTIPFFLFAMAACLEYSYPPYFYRTWELVHPTYYCKEDPSKPTSKL
jgi:hypothetical protein